MKKNFQMVTLLAVFLLMPAHAQSSDQHLKAQAAADSWLALIDAGNSAESWEQAAAFFRAAITKGKWQEAVQAARSPFGRLQQRMFKSAEPATSLPGAPDGQYMVIQYEAKFEHKAKALETVSTQLETDSSWRVIGYFIQ
jgi:hypothetical protein